MKKYFRKLPVFIIFLLLASSIVIISWKDDSESKKDIKVRTFESADAGHPANAALEKYIKDQKIDRTNIISISTSSAFQPGTGIHFVYCIVYK